MRGTWGLLIGALVASSLRVAQAEPLPCDEDDRLAEAAAALLLEGALLAAPTLMPRARAAGFDGVAVHARESTSETALRDWLATLGARGEGRLVCGEARSASRWLVLASRRGGRLWREGERLHAALEPGFSSPSLVVEDAQGALSTRPLSSRALREGWVLAGAPRRVQLVAESESGPRPVAELVLDEDARAAPLAGGDAAPEAEARDETVLAALDAHRRTAGVGTLRPNRLLAESARKHAARVCELGRLAHRVDGEDPAVRLAREHVAARGVGEAIARAGSSEAALRTLLESPSHRLAVGRRDFTDVGVGQGRDTRGQVCLVVLLAAWPRRAP